jgi:hypothetical protein
LSVRRFFFLRCRQVVCLRPRVMRCCRSSSSWVQRLKRPASARRYRTLVEESGKTGHRSHFSNFDHKKLTATDAQALAAVEDSLR